MSKNSRPTLDNQGARCPQCQWGIRTPGKRHCPNRAKHGAVGGDIRRAVGLKRPGGES